MMRKMKESKSEKGKGRREKEYTLVYVWGERTRAKKKSRVERKDYIRDFGFRVSSGRKADFPIFRLSRDEDRLSN